jgi:hypothetical protein
MASERIERLKRSPRRLPTPPALADAFDRFEETKPDPVVPEPTPLPSVNRGYRPPDGAEYVLTFDASMDAFTGRLTVPGSEPVTATAKGRRECYHHLDRAYLLSLQSQLPPR